MGTTINWKSKSLTYGTIDSRSAKRDANHTRGLYANSIASPLSDGHLPMEYLTNSASISHMTLVMWEMEAEFGTYSDVLCHHAWHALRGGSDSKQNAQVANLLWPKAAFCFLTFFQPIPPPKAAQKGMLFGSENLQTSIQIKLKPQTNTFMYDTASLPEGDVSDDGDQKRLGCSLDSLHVFLTWVVCFKFWLAILKRFQINY